MACNFLSSGLNDVESSCPRAVLKMFGIISHENSRAMKGVLYDKWLHQSIENCRLFGARLNTLDFGVEDGRGFERDTVSTPQRYNEHHIICSTAFSYAQCIKGIKPSLQITSSSALAPKCVSLIIFVHCYTSCSSAKTPRYASR
jgi:hypothetical protein